MSDIPNLDAYQAVIDAMAAPKQVTVDGVTSVSHSLPELLEAAKFLQAQRAAARAGRGIQFSRIEPPSAE